MNEKIANCGCGSEAFCHMIGNKEMQGYYICCEECGTKTAIHETLAEAVTTWNRAMGAKDINVPNKFVTDMNVGNKERNKGKWQRRKGSDCWECSQCHAVLENDDLGMHNFYFCYHCGANMMNKSGYMDIEEVHYG